MTDVIKSTPLAQLSEAGMCKTSRMVELLNLSGKVSHHLLVWLVLELNNGFLTL